MLAPATPALPEANFWGMVWFSEPVHVSTLIFVSGIANKESTGELSESGVS